MTRRNDLPSIPHSQRKGVSKQPDWHPLDKVREYYDAYAERYDQDYEKWDWRLYDDLTWHFLAPYLPLDKNTPILDAGGGTGKWAIKIAQAGYHVICGDISDGMLEVARRKVEQLQLESSIKVRKLDVRDMETYPTGSFHLVLALGDVISYVIDDDRAVMEIFRVCKPGGRCVASVDSKLTYLINELNFQHFERVEAFLKSGISHFFTPHPLKTYFPVELRDLFERHGFEVELLAGKPVVTNLVSKSRRKHELPKYYEWFLKLEERFATDSSFLAHAGHLQIVARKPA